MTSRQERLKIAAEVVRREEVRTSQLAEVAAPRAWFAAILALVGRLRPAPSPG